MKLLGIEIGKSFPSMQAEVKGESDFIEMRSPDRIQKIRQGAALMQIPVKTRVVKKNQANPKIYEEWIDI